MNATEAVVEGKMEPIEKTPLTQQLVVTGQYLYETLVGSDGTQTRMAWIREYLVPNADVQQVEGATNEMVKIAHKRDIAMGIPEKERGPKRNTAMQARTHLQAIFGALKFAPEYMTSLGYDAETGWNEARGMAKIALERAGKVWKGLDIPSDVQKEQKALQRANKEETTAFLEATKDTPRALNESFDSWQARIAEVARKQVAKARDDKMLEQAEKEIERLSKKYDRQVLALILMGLQDVLKEDNAGQSEISEEEANALLAAAADAGQVEMVHDEETPVD